MKIDTSISLVFLSALIVLSMSGCNPLDEFPVEPQDPASGDKPWAASDIQASCTVDLQDAPFATRSMIDQTTTMSMEANFLRIDEDINDSNEGLYTFNDGDPMYGVQWKNAYLLEATVSASADNNPEHFRTIYFEPVQSYKINVIRNEQDHEKYDTTQFYHTRMVGWYPRTCDVPRGTSGGAASIQFGDTRYSSVYCESEITTAEGEVKKVAAVQFTGLDGETDLMFSDMKEGQHWHSDSSGSSAPHESDVHPKTGASIYHPPFGHYSQDNGPSYSNVFRYRHYLSAVRVWVYADQSPQNISMWGDITGVSIPGQPTSCKISIPEEEGAFGEAFDWRDERNFDIVTTPMYGENGTENEDTNLSVEFPVSLDGATSASMAYVGYALVRPDHEVRIGIHTTSGVYYVAIDNEYVSSDAASGDSPVEIFKPGYIYDIKLNLQTDGKIAAMLENDSNLRYFDLTTYDEYSEDNQYAVYKYANCYVIDPYEHKYKDETGTEHLYDGYCFSATVVGNGEAGIISSGTQTMYPSAASISPASARLIWESDLGLVSQIELLYGYVRFRVPNKDMRGNAVIGVYDEDGNVLWSWHIWITDSLEEMARTVSTDGAGTITLLDRNLGATKGQWTDETDALDTYGLYYQWGRKDPSMGPATWNYRMKSLVTSTYYDFSLEPKNAAEVKKIDRPTLKDGVENPMYLILPNSQTNNYYFNWMYDDMDFLWGSIEGSDKIHKTIYDPCPFGYRVPLDEIETLLGSVSKSANNKQTYGWTVGSGDNAVFFPYTGYKGVDRGLNSVVCSWSYVGEKADYQSADCYKSTGTRYRHRGRAYISSEWSWNETNVGTYTGYLNVDYTNRRTAAPVRCVKDEDIGSLSADISVSEPVIMPDKEFTVSWTVNSSGSDITEVAVNAVFSRGGVTESRPVWNSADNPGVSLGVLHQHSVSYSITAADLAALDDGAIEFVITAVNSYGFTTSVSRRVSEARAEIDYEAWETKYGKGFYVGQSENLEFRLTGNVPELDIVIGDTSYSVQGQESSENEYIYTVDLPQTFASTGTVGYNVSGSYNGTPLVSGTLSVTVKELVLGQGVSGSFEDGAYYVIKTGDRYLSADDSHGTVPKFTSTYDFTNLFHISNERSGYSFQSVLTGRYLSNSPSWGMPDGIQFSNDRDIYNYSEGNIYYSGWVSKYYWIVDGDSLGIGNEREAADFEICKVDIDL